MPLSVSCRSGAIQVFTCYILEVKTHSTIQRAQGKEQPLTGKFAQDNVSSGLPNPHIIPKEVCLGQDTAGAGSQVCISGHKPLPPVGLCSCRQDVEKAVWPMGSTHAFQSQAFRISVVWWGEVGSNCLGMLTVQNLVTLESMGHCILPRKVRETLIPQESKLKFRPSLWEKGVGQT